MKKFWRSSDHLENSSEYSKNSEREFPNDRFDQLSDSEKSLSRRNFFKIMGSSMMLAGLSASCSYIRKPEYKIYPYVRMPENLVPGNPIYYATSYQIREEVTGLLVESQEGRPTKIEGNPLYPSNKGASNAFQQASILNLYDPDRYKNVLIEKKKVSKSEVDRWIGSLNLDANEGQGVGILTDYSLSPTFHRLLGDIRRKYPKIRVYRYESVNNDNIYQGVYDITGRWAMPIVDYKNADVVVSLNSDFLGIETGSFKSNQEFMKRRRVEDNDFNRLYQFENTFSITGGVADHRFRIKRSEVDLIAYAILRQFYKKGIFRTNKFLVSFLERALIDSVSLTKENDAYRYISTIVDDLERNTSRSVVVAGPGASPLVHSLVYYINYLIKAPIDYYIHPYADQDYVRRSSADSIKGLSEDLKSGQVANLMILGQDPVYHESQKLNLDELVKKANVFCMADCPNETAGVSNMVVPRSNYLETWSDYISTNGIVSVGQPLISPLYESFSEIEILSKIFGESKKSGMDLVKETHNNSDFSWEKSLHNGFAKDRSRDFIRRTEPVNVDRFSNSNKSNFVIANGDLEITFDPDYSVYDGRFINNSWLQELPDPITKMTWENVVIISHALAKEKNLESYDVVKLSVGDRSIEGAIWVLPGQEDKSISLKLGYGHKVVGRVGKGSGFNASVLKLTDGKDFVQEKISIQKLNRKEKLATVQDHWAIKDEIFEGKPSSNSQDGRPLYRQNDLVGYERNPNFAKDAVEVPHLKEYHDRLKKNKKKHPMYAENMSIFNEWQYTSEYQWGMAIDLSTCTGCNACMVSCQAENNIPVVGKEMVLMGREMHWIRIDRYFEGDPVAPQMVSQPVTCLQCEQAPCEPVCPVAATVHSEEGLNDMVYNRCIGTRFCSNNCPVKVRRFNYFDYHQRSPYSKKKVSSHIFELFREPEETVQMQFNPDVTVRMRGVMEKCTYCVQRINRSRVEAKNEGRKIRDGEIKVACEQTCPTGSIVFGNIKDPNSKVSQAKKKARDYHLLAELNLKPRTSYLAAIKNPNKKIKV